MCYPCTTYSRKKGAGRGLRWDPGTRLPATWIPSPDHTTCRYLHKLLWFPGCPADASLIIFSSLRYLASSFFCPIASTTLIVFDLSSSFNHCSDIFLTFSSSLNLISRPSLCRFMVRGLPGYCCYRPDEEQPDSQSRLRHRATSKLINSSARANMCLDCRECVSITPLPPLVVEYYNKP